MTVENGLPGFHKKNYTHLYIYDFRTKVVLGDLEISQEFVNSITECLRDF